MNVKNYAERIACLQAKYGHALCNMLNAAAEELLEHLEKHSFFPDVERSASITRSKEFLNSYRALRCMTKNTDVGTRANDFKNELLNLLGGKERCAITLKIQDDDNVIFTLLI